MKTCPTCKTDKPISDFHKNKRYKSGFRNICKDCSNKRRNENYNPLKNKRNNLKVRYGISLEEYEEMFNNQNGKCLGCVRKIFIEVNSDTPAVVDHNHSTGSVRGLLCDSCNRALGNIKDNIETLKNLIKYLEKSK